MSSLHIVSPVDVTSPSVPGGLSAVAASQTQINVSWLASNDGAGSGVAGYKLFRDGTLIQQANVLSFADTGLSAGVAHSYQVQAIDGVGNLSAISGSVVVSTLSVAPSIPTGVSALAVSSSQINLAWAASTDVGGPGLKDYGIYRGGALLGYTAGLSYNDTGLTASTLYSYRFTARDVNNLESAMSATVTATTAASGAPQTIVHNQSFTITGSGFGDVGSRNIVAYDACTAPVNTIDGQWTNDNYPSTAGGNDNIQLQPAGFVSASGFAAGPPDPFHAQFYTGTHLQTNTATGGNAVCRSVRYTAPAKPYPLIQIYPYRLDTGWVTDPKSDNNLKDNMISLGPSMQPVSGNFRYWNAGDTTTGNNNPYAITGISQAAQAVITTSYNAATAPVAVGAQVYVDTVVGMTQINQVYGTVLAANRVSTFWTFTVNINSSAFSAYASGGGVWTPKYNTLVSVQTATDGKQGATGPMMQDPDLVTGKIGGFYLQNLWPINPANGWIAKRFETLVTTDTSVSSPGYERQYDNCALTANYFGKTVFDDSGATTQVTVTIGQYARDRHANNRRYYGRTLVAIGGTGDTNVPRVMIGNASTLAACTVLEYAPDTSWADGQINIKPWQGNFANGSTAYLYVYKRTGGVPTTPSGSATWAPAPTFDFFISQTGSDSNPGTLAAPWAITAFNTKQATYAGKRLGVIGAHYNVNSLMSSTAGLNLNLVALGVNGGTGGAITYVASCNSAGTYQARAAVLDAHTIQNQISAVTRGTSTVITVNSNAATNPYVGQPRVAITLAQGVPQLLSPDTGLGAIWMYMIASTGGVQGAWTFVINNVDGTSVDSSGWGAYTGGGWASAGSPTAECGIIGQGYSNSGANLQTTMGSFTVDGLVLTGSFQGGILIHPNTSLRSVTGVSLLNNEIADIAGYCNDNSSGILLVNLNGARVAGNKVHHVIPTTGNVSGQDNAGIFSFGCVGNIYENNTLFATTVGIYDKNANNGGQTIRYNFIKQTRAGILAGPYATCGMTDTAGGNTGDVKSVHHNIIDAPQIWIGSNPFHDPSLEGLTFYSNTSLFSGGTDGGLWFPALGTGVAKVSQYNNIYACSGTPGYEGFIDFVQASIQLSDYNAYSNSGAYFCFTPPSGGFAPSATMTFAQWKTATAMDGHSVIGTPTLLSPAALNTPAAYALVSGIGKGTGSTTGTTSGAATDMGAFGNAAISVPGSGY